MTQAYIKLLCIPEHSGGPRMISLERIGAHEIRMFEAPRGSDDAPLFWLELFDHGRQSSLDSCSCYDIPGAAAAFDGFVAEAKRLAEIPPQQDGETPG
jgi:hypothetical protein